MTTLGIRGPVAGMSTPGWESVLTPVSYVTRVKHGFYTDFYSHDRIFSKPCRYFFHKGKNTTLVTPWTRDRYGDPMHTLK